MNGTALIVSSSKGTARPAGPFLTPERRVKHHLAWLFAYLVILAGLTGGMLAVRGWALQSYDRPQSHQEWDQWRRQTQQLAEEPGPVARRPAKSPEPPTIVLLRDHFAACLGLLLLLSSVLFGTLMFMIRGVAATPPLNLDTNDDPPQVASSSATRNTDSPAS